MGYSGDNLRSPSTNNLILISYLQGAYNQFTYQEMNAWKEQRGRSSPTWTWILHTHRASTWDSILQSDSTTEVEDTACRSRSRSRSRISEITSQGRSFATKYLTRSEEVTAILPTVLSYFPPMLVVHKQGNVKEAYKKGEIEMFKKNENILERPRSAFTLCCGHTSTSEIGKTSFMQRKKAHLMGKNIQHIQTTFLNEGSHNI